MTRILITAAAGCILTGGIGYLLLPVLRALKAGQSIREIGPTWHNSKAGTPMMGGLMFIFGTILCLVGNFPAMSDDSPFYVLALALCFGLIGFLDDFTKVKFHRNLGLTTLQKAMLQMAVSALFLYAMYRSGFMDTHLYIPFMNVSFQLHPIVYIFFAMFVMVGTDNAVNLTDGKDGLATGCTIFCTLTYAAFAYLMGHAVFANYLKVPFIPGAGEGMVFAAAVCGGCIGFLWHNCHPASMFMGDTGSLALGGAVGFLAVLVRQEVLLILVGGVFVMEAGSVMLQVPYFKLTGKRIFPCTPIHHTFERRGWTETQIVVRFWILSGVFALIALATLKLR